MKVEKIKIADIKFGENTRNVLGDLAEKYDYFDGEGSKKPSLLRLGTGGAKERKKFCELVAEELPGIVGLATSITQNGLINAISVSQAGNNSAGFELRAGYRRLLAVVYGLASGGVRKPDAWTIDASVVKAQQPLAFSLAENIQRQGVNAMEEASVYQKLSNLGLKKKQIGDHVGRSHTHVASRLALLELEPEIQDRIAAGKLKPFRALAQAKKKSGTHPPRKVRSVKPSGAMKRISKAKESFEHLCEAVEQSREHFDAAAFRKASADHEKFAQARKAIQDGLQELERQVGLLVNNANGGN